MALFAHENKINPGKDSNTDMEVAQMPLDDQSIRPFFLGSGLDLETLPPDLKAAIEQIVVPIYERYVLRANGPLEAVTGASLTFLMALEVLSQYSIGQETFGCLKPTPEQSVL